MSKKLRETAHADRGRMASALGGMGGRRVALLACAMLVGGVAMSLVGAGLWRAEVQENERSRFEGTAADVTQTVGVLLRRDTDFATTLRAVQTLQPHMTNAAFVRWFAQLQGRERLAGGLGAIVMARIPASFLATFEARRAADPGFRALVRGSPLKVPRANRSTYCLLAGGVLPRGLSEETLRVLQEDWCGPSSLLGAVEGPFLRAQTDTGALLVEPATGAEVNTVVFATAFYTRGSETLGSVAERRAAVSGWILTSIDMPTMLREATRGHADLALSLYRTNPGRGSTLIGRVGPGGRSHTLTHTQTLQVEGGWTVKIAGTPARSAMSAELQSLWGLLSGVAVTALIVALILSLGGSRERAWRLVREATGELRHRALHDALTGLPNRVLALDRAQQMLASARRRRTPVAALYVDIDGFKNINDTYGHAAGDEVLQTVAARLGTVVRNGDTAGRLGGDEFVVLLEGPTLEGGAELVAERLLEILRRPCELSHSPIRELSVTASIGIATGVRASADELLRDADLALYAAKTAGRNRYALFTASMHSDVGNLIALPRAGEPAATHT